MKWSGILSAILAVASFTAFGHAFGQTAPAAREGQLPFSIGGGISNFDVDWGKNRMYGIAIWGQWHPGSLLPRMLDGLALDIEARDIDYGRGNSLPSNFRQDTAGGGPMYTWNRFRNFRPYGKGLIEFGSFDFRTSNPGYTHDTRALWAPGLGFQLRTFPHVWIRADYEYQIWQQMLGKTPDPQGFTLGATYDFRHVRLF